MNVLLTLCVFFTLAFCVTVDGQQVVISNNTSNTTETKLENDFSYSETDAYAISSLTNFTVNETVPNMVLEENVCEIQSNGCDRNKGLCYSEVQCNTTELYCKHRNLSTYDPNIVMVCQGYYSESNVSEYRGYIKNIFCNVSQLPEVQSCNVMYRKGTYLRIPGGPAYGSVVRLIFSPPTQVESVLQVSRHLFILHYLKDDISISYRFPFCIITTMKQ